MLRGMALPARSNSVGISLLRCSTQASRTRRLIAHRTHLLRIGYRGGAGRSVGDSELRDRLVADFHLEPWQR